MVACENGEDPDLGDCDDPNSSGTIGVDKGVLPADGQSKAQASPEAPGQICWSLVGDTHGATIDPATGEITAGHEEGWITIRASLCDDPDCFKDIQIWQSEDGEDCKDCQESGCVEGAARIGLSSIDVAFPLGKTLDGEPVGYLSIFEPELSDALRTPDVLEYPHTPDVTVIRDDDGHLLQLRAPRMLVEIKPWENPTRYDILFFKESDFGEIDSNGLYSHGGATTDWVCTYTDTDPAHPTFSVYLQDAIGPDGIGYVTYLFSKGSGSDSMNLDVSSLNGTTYRRETMEWPEPGEVREHAIQDASGSDVRRVRETFEDDGFGHQMVTERIVDPGGIHRTTTYDYYPAGAPTGKPGRLKSVIDPDGQWTWYDYDGQSRQTLVVRAWKDVEFPVSGDPDPASARATYYDYQQVDPEDSLDADPERPRTVTETIEGITARKTYYAYYYDASTNAKVVIEERCHSASAAYGDALNLRTTTTYVPGDDKKIAKIVFPDGMMDEYTYEVGDYEAHGASGNYTFEEIAADSDSIDLRETLTHYTDDSQTLLPAKSTREIRITDAADNELVTETDFWDGGNWVRIDWTQNGFDSYNYQIESFRSNEVYTKATWSCCVKKTETDITNLQTTHTYDDLGRKIADTKQSLGTLSSYNLYGLTLGPYDSQPAVRTTFTLDPLNRVTATATGADDGMGGYSTVLSSSREFDQAGRIVSETDEANLETTYDYVPLVGGRGVWMTTPDGLTQITTYSYDGQLVVVNGPNVVNEFHDYGIEADGTQWTKVEYDPADGPSETTYFDMLGRKIREERTGLTDQTIRTYYEYDQGGRLTHKWSDVLIVDPGSGGPGIGSGQLDPPGPIGGGGGPGGGSGSSETVVDGLGDMLFVYDANGALTRTCQDINRNSAIDLAGPDRVTDTDMYYIRYGDDWWQETVTSTYPENNTSPTPVSIERQQLTGLGLHELGITRSESVDMHGNVTTTETFDDDSFNWLVTKTTPPSGGPQNTVTRGGILQAATTSTGLRYAYHYDSIGRPIQTEDPRTGTSTTHYNALGQIDWIKDAEQNQTTFQYDSAGRRISVTNPDGNVSRYAYGATTGLLERVWGDVPQPVEFTYDSLSLAMTSMSTFRGGTGWNGETWPSTPGAADVTQWNRDSRTGLLLDKTYPDGSQVTYTYNRNLSLEKRTWARDGGSLTTEYSYHGQTGQLTVINYSDATPDVVYSYDRLGRLSTVIDAVGYRTLSYNAALQPDAEVIIDNGIGLYEKAIQRTYQTTGTPGRYAGFTVGPDLANPDTDYTSGYEYDPATGRLSGISGTALPSGGVAYAHLGDSDLIAGLEYKEDPQTVLATTTRGYETGRDLLTSVENKWGASVISKYDYLSDNLGRRSSVVYTGSAFAGGAGDHFSLYDYNDRNELTASTGYSGSDPADLSQPTYVADHGYAYDPIGNRTSYDPPGQGVSLSYTSNALNQYETITATVPIETFVYDDDGNMVLDGTLAYGWDAANRLITVAPAASPQEGDKLLTFTYDYRGRRVRKVAQTWDPALNGGAGGWSATLAEDRRFVYDGWNLVLELDGLNGNATLRKYAWGLDVSGSTQGAGGIGGLLAMEDVGGTISTSDDENYLCFYDGNGNVGQLVGLSAGTLAAHYEYDPYGNSLLDISDPVASGPYAAANPFRFSTKYLDDETGLSYYGYRYYSPRLGRWMNRDPIGEEGVPNLFSFLFNCPENYYDYLGQEPIAPGNVSAPRCLKPEGSSSGGLPGTASQPTTQPKQSQNRSKACCQYRETVSVAKGPPIFSSASYFQQSSKCPKGAKSALKCCKSDCLRVVGTVVTSRSLRSAYWGSCCSCTVEVRRLPGGWPQHVKIFVSCSDGTKWVADHPPPGSESISSKAMGIQLGLYPTIVESYRVSCGTASMLRKKADSLRGAGYGLVQDCYWYPRQVLGDKSRWVWDR